MSTLTSLVKSGKRRIVKTRTDFTPATSTVLGRPDRGVPQDPTRPRNERQVVSNMTPLGLPDQGVSHDPMRPQNDTLSSSNMTPLGLPDQGVSRDPMRPE